MDSQNLNLITVIKYLQEQYTLNERNRINYELLLKNKQLQANKQEANKNLNYSLSNLNLKEELENSQQVQQVINDSKHKLSSVLKDINILLHDSEAVKDVVYKRLTETQDTGIYESGEKLALVTKRRFTSNIALLEKVVLHNSDAVSLIDFTHGMIETRSFLDGNFTILKQEVSSLLKEATQCWYMNTKEAFLVNSVNKDTIVNLGSQKTIDLEKKDLFYKFDSCFDFKYDKLIFLDGFNAELIKVVDINSNSRIEINLNVFSVYSSSNQRVLDLKFGITETSILVLTDKSLLIIDYSNNTLLSELKLDIEDQNVVEGVLTVNTNFNNLLLTFIKEDHTVKNYIYSLEIFKISNELTHSFNFFDGSLRQLLAIENSVYYLFDKQIQIRAKDGVLKNKYSIKSDNVFSSIVVNDGHFYHLFQETKNSKVTIQLLESE